MLEAVYHATGALFFLIGTVVLFTEWSRGDVGDDEE